MDSIDAYCIQRRGAVRRARRLRALWQAIEFAGGVVAGVLLIALLLAMFWLAPLFDAWMQGAWIP